MDRRTFNSLMHFNNERWTAQALNMQINPNRGPDLIDAEKIVEVKFKLIHSSRHNHLSWKVLGYQKEYGRPNEAYWALGTYALDREIDTIRNSATIPSLERMVRHRELFIVRWDWMNQFQEYHEIGKTEKSQWDHVLIFPKERLLPPTEKEYLVYGGKVFITKGVNPKKFFK